MSASFMTLDTRGFDRQMEALVLATGKPMADIVRQEAKALFSSLIRLTFPVNLAQGENAIAKDLSNVAFGANRKLIDDVVTRTGKISDIDAWITRQNKEHSHIQWAAVGMDVHAIAAWHEARRNKNGRTSQHRARADGDRMVVPKAVYAQYLTMLKSRVGRMKSGWIPALKLAAGTAPAWVSRHSAVPGQSIDGLGNGSKPTVTGINTAPGIAAPDMGKTLQSAYDIRAKAMSVNVALYLKGVKQRAGL